MKIVTFGFGQGQMLVTLGYSGHMTYFRGEVADFVSKINLSRYFSSEVSS